MENENNEVRINGMAVWNFYSAVCRRKKSARFTLQELMDECRNNNFEDATEDEVKALLASDRNVTVDENGDYLDNFYLRFSFPNTSN